MKRLLAVLIVLGLCGAAGATTVPVVSFEDEGTTIITTPEGVVSLDIVTDSPFNILHAIVTVEGDAIITGAMNSSDADQYGWDPTFPLDPIGLGTKSVELGGVAFPGTATGTIAYVEITYGSGEVVVSGWPRRPTMPGPPPPPVYFSDGVVTIIPEPATFLLFGLGALLLHRRGRDCQKFTNISSPDRPDFVS